MGTGIVDRSVADSPRPAATGPAESCTVDRAERRVRRLGAHVAMLAAGVALPGLRRSMQPATMISGRPERSFTPSRLIGIAAGWFGVAVVAWRPLPVRPRPMARWLLLGGGAALYAAGMTLVVAGRLALGSAYRPSSTFGAALVPGQRLVTSGPFAYVRHPMYLGLVLASLGALAMYRTWTTLLFVAQTPILIVRARREDRLLALAFDADWVRYAGRVPAWLPRVR